MDFKNFRIITTPFYSECAYEIMRAVLDQLSDGLWKNSRGYEKYWVNFDVIQQPDDRIVFKVNHDLYGMRGSWCIDNPFAKMSDGEFLNWFAKKLKAVINAEAKDNNWEKGWWSRNDTWYNSINLNYKLDVTVADIYCIYDWLKGRPCRTEKSILDDLFGKAATDEEIARRKEYDAARAKLVEEHHKELEDINAQLKAAQKRADAMKSVADAKFKAAFEELASKYKAA